MRKESEWSRNEKMKRMVFFYFYIYQFGALSTYFRLISVYIWVWRCMIPIKCFHTMSFIVAAIKLFFPWSHLLTFWTKCTCALCSLACFFSLIHDVYYSKSCSTFANVTNVHWPKSNKNIFQNQMIFNYKKLLRSLRFCQFLLKLRINFRKIRMSIIICSRDISEYAAHAIPVQPNMLNHHGKFTRNHFKQQYSFHEKNLLFPNNIAENRKFQLNIYFVEMFKIGFWQLLFLNCLKFSEIYYRKCGISFGKFIEWDKAHKSDCKSHFEFWTINYEHLKWAFAVRNFASMWKYQACWFNSSKQIYSNIHSLRKALQNVFQIHVIETHLKGIALKPNMHLSNFMTAQCTLTNSKQIQIIQINVVFG